MKTKIVTLSIIFSVLAISIWFFSFVYKKGENGDGNYPTETPVVTDIVKKVVLTGTIIPKKEVQIKSQTSGIIEKLFVEAGQKVKNGQLIARITIIPNMVALNQAEAGLENARITFLESEKELERNEALLKLNATSQQEYDRMLADYSRKKEALRSAENNLELIKRGTSKRSGKVANLVYSTIDGILLDLPVKEGSSVIERNTFNEGTTIATIADMNNLVFEGKIDESEVGNLKQGMQLDLSIGAIRDVQFKAMLKYISQKGTMEDGAIKFQIRADIVSDSINEIRAGYSANADIVLGRRSNVVAVNEGLIRFEKNIPYVEVEVAPQKFERKELKLGLSDGIFAEVISGVTAGDKIKKP